MNVEKLWNFLIVEPSNCKTAELWNYLAVTVKLVNLITLNR